MLGRTFLQHSNIENEVGIFLNYIGKKFNISDDEMLDAISSYANDLIKNDDENAHAQVRIITINTINAQDGKTNTSYQLDVPNRFLFRHTPIFDLINKCINHSDSLKENEYNMLIDYLKTNDIKYSLVDNVNDTNKYNSGCVNINEILKAQEVNEVQEVEDIDEIKSNQRGKTLNKSNIQKPNVQKHVSVLDISKIVEKVKNDLTSETSLNESSTPVGVSENEELKEPSVNNTNLSANNSNKLKITKLKNGNGWDKNSNFVFDLKTKPPTIIGKQSSPDSDLIVLTKSDIDLIKLNGWKVKIKN